jgi:hypothetical protein
MKVALVDQLQARNKGWGAHWQCAIKQAPKIGVDAGGVRLASKLRPPDYNDRKMSTGLGQA